MARRSRTSSQTDKEKVSHQKGLAPAYGKVGDNKYVVYADTKKQGEDHPRVLVLNFKAEYAAAWFIQKLIGNDEWKWIDPIGSRQCIETTGGVRISMFKDDLKMLLEYKPTAIEAEWKDEMAEKSAMRLRFGTTWEVEAKPKYEEVEVEDEKTGEIKKVKQKIKKEKKPKKEKKAKIDKSGLVTAGELAEKLNIEPRIFRGALRAMKKVKPEGGWLWKPDDAKAIRVEVEKFLKKEKKKKK